MIQVTIRVHSILKEVVGKPCLLFQIPEGSSMDDLLAEVFRQFKDGFKQRYQLRDGDWNIAKYFIVALNGNLLPNKSGLDRMVREGDVIDIMEPIAGG